MGPDTGWISNGLARWVTLVLRFRWPTMLAGLLAGVLCMSYAARNLGINTDTANMISASLPWRQHFIDYRETFAIRDRNLIVVVDAPSPEQADRIASALAGRLRERTDLYRSVFLAGDGEFFERNGLLFLPLAELQTLADRLAAAQPLLGRLKRRFDGVGLIEVVGEAAGRGGEDIGVPGALYAELAASIEAAARGERVPLSWQQLLTGDAAARSVLLLQPVEDFNRVRPAAPAIDAIRSAATELLAAEPGEASVRLTGSVALEHEELFSVSRSAGLAGLAALIMVAAVLYWALRSVVLVGIAVLTLIAGLAGTAAFAAAAVGHLNLLSVAFAVLYIGLGIDFIIHLSLRLKELLAGGLALDAALIETSRSVGSSLVICAITTAAGFYAFIPTPFQGVSELGLISGTGMFISLFASVTLLPALAAVCLPVAGGASGVRWFGARLFAPLTDRPGRVLVGCALLLTASLAALPGVRFDSNPVHLRDPGSESVATLQDLAAGSDAAMLQLVAIAPDHGTALEWAERLEALAGVREVRTAQSLLPPQQQSKQDVLEDLALLLGSDFAELDRRAPDADAFLASLGSLREQLREPPAATEALQLAGAIDTLIASLAQQPVAARNDTLRALENDLLLNLPPQLERLDTGLGAEPFGRDALPEALTARWYGPDGRELVEIVPAENMLDDEAARRIVDQVRDVVPNATGIPVVNQEASRTVVRAFQLAFAYALAMVVAILLLFLRNLKDALLVVIPILFAAAVTAGLTVLLDIPFNFANVIALPLLMGVGVDSSIHIVHRMRTAPPADGRLFSTSTSRAVFASGLTTIASFGNLAFASHLGMASMGKLLTLGMIVTLTATLILLPALLRLRNPATA